MLVPVPKFPISVIIRSQHVKCLIPDGELYVGLRDFDDHVSIVLGQPHRLNDWPSPPLRVSDRFELDINFDIGAVPTDKSALQSGGYSTFCREDLEEVRSCHARLDGRHFFQNLSQPSVMVLCARLRTRRMRGPKGSKTSNNDE
jgi:hypothetical protein